MTENDDDHMRTVSPSAEAPNGRPALLPGNPTIG